MAMFGMKDKSKSRGYQSGKSRREPLGRQETLFDVLGRNLLGQQVGLAETPISVPLQQSVSGMQDVMQPLFNQAFGAQTGAGLAGRLAGQGAVSGIQPAAGAPVFGRTQTREELGIPPRRDAFPFTPTPEEILGGPGLPPIRSTPAAKRADEKARRAQKKESKLEGRIEKIEGRIGRRKELGLGTGRQEKRLARVQRHERRAERRRVQLNA